MLQRNELAKDLPYDDGDERRRTDPSYNNGHARRRVDLLDAYTFVKSNRRIVAGWTIVTLTAALMYAFTATPLYTATTELALDSRKIALFKNNDQVIGDNARDSQQVESEVEVVRSKRIALAVVKDLNLTSDPDFVDTSNGPFMRLLSAIFGYNEDAPHLSDAERERIAVDSLLNSLSVRRMYLTYVLEISFRSPDRQKAVTIANAVADAYITDQLTVKYEAARRASVWLEGQIAELKSQSNSAARAVEAYKEKNNIVDTGNGHGLLSELQLQQLNTQMITAAAATAEAKARLERVEQVLKSPTPGEALGTVSDTLHDDVITRLRQRYLDDREHVAQWTPVYGPNHLAVIRLRNEMAELQNSIVDELQRIAQTYKSDYEIAKAREDSLRASLGKQIQEAGASGQAQVELKELQATSQTYHSIFGNFLEKYTEAVQQQTFPISDARVISAATPPYHKSYPKTALVALLGLLAGLGGGLGHSLVLRNFDRAVRRPRDIEERLHLECLGLVPLIAPGKQSNPMGGSLKLLGKIGRGMKLFGTPGQPDSGRGANPTTASPDLTYKVVDEPFSHFSEGLRAVKTALDILALTRPIQCIGMISALPGEGKSTVAINLANVLASGGRTTLLIDADLRNPELSRRLSPDAKSGLLELMVGSTSLSQVTQEVSEERLHFLPVVLRQRIANSGDLLGSKRMQAVLSAARPQFDQLLVDLPPLGPVSDARAISPLVDAFILVVNWGETRFDVIEEALVHFGIARDKIVGVVLNKVNFHELRNMEPFSQGYYYNKHYAKYGYTYSDL
jgi:succinoglycan biosynthesis transport protein ExoP